MFVNSTSSKIGYKMKKNESAKKNLQVFKGVLPISAYFITSMGTNKWDVKIGKDMPFNVYEKSVHGMILDVVKCL